MIGQLVVVTWQDIVSDSAWHSVTSAKKKRPCLCENVGWVLVDEASKLTLIAGRQTSKGNKEVGDLITIPRGCVVSIRVLEDD